MLDALFVTASAERVDVIVRNVVIASVTRDRVADPRCERIEISSSQCRHLRNVRRIDRARWDRPSLRLPGSEPAAGDRRCVHCPDRPCPTGLSLSAVIDTRYTTSPTPLKLAAMLGGITATVIALLALWRMDRLDGRRAQRLIPTRWRTFSAVDVTVIVITTIWYVAGAGSSDDGYQLQMARVAGHAGYMSNYFRWFGSPEDPFGWYYNLLALMTSVSDTSLWIRLPDLVCVLVCWALLSREVLPRLGPAVTGNTAAVWAAAMVLTAAWMPFNNGLAPRGPDRHGRPDHLCTHRTRHHHSPCHPGRAGHRHRRLHSWHPAHRADRGRRATGRWSTDPADRRGSASSGGDLAPGGASARSRVRSPDRHLRRPNLRLRSGSHQGAHRDRPQPTLVHGESALLLSNPAHHRRRSSSPIRHPDHPCVPLFDDPDDVAAQTDCRRSGRARVAVDGNHLRHGVLSHLCPDEVDPPLRSVRSRRRRDGSPGHRPHGARGIAIDT